MIVFQELNFDPVKEILKCDVTHIYILMKKVIILRKIHVKMEVFRSAIERNQTYSRSAADLLHTVLE